MSRSRLLLSTTACVLAIGACQTHGAPPTPEQRVALSNRPDLREQRINPDVDCRGFDQSERDTFLQRRMPMMAGMPTPPPPPVMAAPATAEMARPAAAKYAPAMAAQVVVTMPPPMAIPPRNTERYERPDDNPVKRVREAPLSTFSIDVDTGSYSNVRSLLRHGERPPADAVRTEEFINYFDYGHPAPTSREVPFRVTTELATAPWNGKRALLMVGIKGYDVPKAALPPANLVFLVDTSGSMSDPDKLPLVQTALCRMLPSLRAQDRVSIVAYAGSAGLVLPPTAGTRRRDILDALRRLDAGGSTNGGEGIQLAYATAREAYREGGINRVLLATDGDFNVGVSDQKALETLVGDQRKSGIALSTLGVGRGNYNDAMAERLADVGNGNHAYIDSAREAEKVLVRSLQSTLMTIASDVKIQVEFNPAQVAEYRLIGYENRALRDEDFANDAVDAGEIGAGHEVTALYELALVGSGGEQLPALRYGAAASTPTTASSELALLKLRYKLPGQSESRLIETPLQARSAGNGSDRLRFAAAVAAYADALRGGERIGMDWTAIDRLAQTGAPDPHGDRAEFRQLLQEASKLSTPTSTGGAQ